MIMNESTEMMLKIFYLKDESYIIFQAFQNWHALVHNKLKQVHKHSTIFSRYKCHLVQSQVVVKADKASD